MPITASVMRWSMAMRLGCACACSAGLVDEVVQFSNRELCQSCEVLVPTS